MINKVSIIGCGSVGSTLAFHLLSRLNFSELSLIDIAADTAQGIALDLEDTRGLLGFNTRINASSEKTLLKDSDIVIFTAGIARKPGMTRQDLFATNRSIAVEFARAIKALAPQAIIIAVTNPLDAITAVFLKETGFSRFKVMGMGAGLDSSRLLNLLFLKSNISPASLEAFVFGLHNQDMIVSVPRFKVKGQNATSVLPGDELKAIVQRTKDRGTEIVSHLKTRSAYFAPSLACAFLVEAIACDSGKVIPVSVCLSGEYGLKDVCLAVPCVLAREGIKKIIELDLTVEEKQQLEKVKEYYREFVV